MKINFNDNKAQIQPAVYEALKKMDTSGDGVLDSAQGELGFRDSVRLTSLLAGNGLRLANTKDCGVYMIAVGGGSASDEFVAGAGCVSKPAVASNDNYKISKEGEIHISSSLASKATARGVW